MTHLRFEPRISKEWNGYSFKINFRNPDFKISVHQNKQTLAWKVKQAISVFRRNGKKEVLVEANKLGYSLK